MLTSKKAAKVAFTKHPKIVFKTSDEIEKLRKSKSKKYTLLWETDSERWDLRAKKQASIAIPTINYSRAEKKMTKLDYTIFKPTFFSEKGSQYAGYLFLFKMMNNHIDEMVKTKKKQGFVTYARNQAKANCIKGKTAYLLKDDIHKRSSIAKMNAKFDGAKVKTISLKKAIAAIENDKDLILGFSFPVSIISGKSGIMSVATIKYFRSLINVKTGKVYGFYQISMGTGYDAYFRNKDFSKFSRCKK